MWAATNVIKSKPEFPTEINAMATPWHSLRLWNLKENSKLHKIQMNEYRVSFLLSLPGTA